MADEQNQNQMDLLNVKEAAEYTKFSVAFLYRLAKANRIPHVKFGRRLIFRKSDLYSWLGSMVSFESPDVECCV